MSHRKPGIVKVVLAVVLVALAAASFLFMTQEQNARDKAELALEELGRVIDDGKQFGPEEVHQLIGVEEPSDTRDPNRHRHIEEYTWHGPFSEHTVYAYYDVAATKILEAVSMNKKLDDWED